MESQIVKKSRILIVDDDPAITRFIQPNLEARNNEVLVAADGDQALKMIKQEKNLDLILLDIMMPGIDGFEVCKQIRQFSDIPILMLSAREGEGDMGRCFACGANAYLTKPFALKELLSQIKTLLKRD
jgi:DNA-binding response OmpR family regulator